MAKKARVYDGTAWQELASAQTDLTAYSTTAQMNTAITAALPTWISYTPTVTSTAGAITSYTVNTARYSELGKVVFLMFDITVSNNGTGSSSLNITLPSGKNARDFNHHGSGRELLLSGSMLSIYNNTATNLRVHTYNNAYPVNTGARICGSFVYELA